MSELDRLRPVMLERCKGFCEVCGSQLGESWAQHHRKLRSQGGKDVLSNLLAVHHPCHTGTKVAIHQNVAWAQVRGYIVFSGWDPLETPVLLYGERGWWVTLDDEGGYRKIDKNADDVPSMKGE